MIAVSMSHDSCLSSMAAVTMSYGCCSRLLCQMFQFLLKVVLIAFAAVQSCSHSSWRLFCPSWHTISFLLNAVLINRVSCSFLFWKLFLNLLTAVLVPSDSCFVSFDSFSCLSAILFPSDSCSCIFWQLLSCSPGCCPWILWQQLMFLMTAVLVSSVSCFEHFDSCSRFFWQLFLYFLTTFLVVLTSSHPSWKLFSSTPVLVPPNSCSNT